MKSLWVWETCFAADTHAMKSLWVWEACFVADTHAMKSLWVWEACFVADTHVMKSLWVWEAYYVADTHVMKSLWVWEACFVADTLAMKSLWVWEACFVADTHTEKSLWVSEAYSIAIPKSWKTEGITRKLYIPKCLPWVFCILKSFQKPVARSWGKDKQTLSSRRYHSVPRDALRGYCPRLCTATVCVRSGSGSAVLSPNAGYGDSIAFLN